MISSIASSCRLPIFLAGAPCPGCIVEVFSDDEDEGEFFYWGSEDEPEGIDYLIKMQEISSETVIITIIRPDDMPMQEGEAAHLLKLIKKYLA